MSHLTIVAATNKWQKVNHNNFLLKKNLFEAFFNILALSFKLNIFLYQVSSRLHQPLAVFPLAEMSITTPLEIHYLPNYYVVTRDETYIW